MHLPRREIRIMGIVGLAALLLGGCEQSGEAKTASPASPAAAATASRDAGSTPRASEPTLSTATPRRPPTTQGTRQVTLGDKPATRSPERLGRPPVEFDPPILDFGYLKPNEKGVGTIQIRNVGEEPIKILQASPSCRCTALGNVRGKVIAPGSSVPMTVQLDGRSTFGTRTASIKFVFEGYGQALDFDLKADVAFAVRPWPSIFNTVKGDLIGQMVVESVDGRTFNVLAADRKPPRFIGFDPELEAPRSRYVLEWDLTEYTVDTMPRWWVIETDHPEAPLVDASVRHKAFLAQGREASRGRGWRVEDRRVILGLSPVGEPIEFGVTIVKLGTDRIYAVRSLSRDFNAELVSLERKGSNADCTVRITPREDFRGLLLGRIEFLSSSASQRIDVVAKLVE